jgi:hypothetical protein
VLSRSKERKDQIKNDPNYFESYNQTGQHQTYDSTGAPSSNGRPISRYTFMQSQNPMGSQVMGSQAMGSQAMGSQAMGTTYDNRSIVSKIDNRSMLREIALTKSGLLSDRMSMTSYPKDLTRYHTAKIVRKKYDMAFENDVQMISNKQNRDQAIMYDPSLGSKKGLPNFFGMPIDIVLSGGKTIMKTIGNVPIFGQIQKYF